MGCSTLCCMSETDVLCEIRLSQGMFLAEAEWISIIKNIYKKNIVLTSVEQVRFNRLLVETKSKTY